MHNATMNVTLNKAKTKLKVTIGIQLQNFQNQNNVKDV
jgi:hypothetical protein